MEALWGVVSIAALFFVVIWFVGPTRNDSSNSSNYDHDRHLKNPTGWHADPLRKQTKRYKKKQAGSK